MPRKSGVPSYRKRRIRDRDSAVVTLSDGRSKRRKDFWLGAYGSPESHERYHRLLAAWEACGRRLVDESRTLSTGGLTVTEVCHKHRTATKGRYSRSYEINLRAAIRVLRKLHGTTPAEAFGPNALRLVRNAMIQGDSKADPPRKPWSRPVANHFVRIIVSIFKWAVAHELIEPRVHEALRTTKPLRRGQTAAHEPEPVRPVPEVFVDAALEHMRPQVCAMVELQRVTGMRPGEVVIMRTRDIDTTGRVWVYTPVRHKTLHHGYSRQVYLGPRGQEILRPWLRASLEDYLFQPAEAVAQQRAERHAARKTPLEYGNRPGTNRQANPKRQPRDRYTTDSYRRAIERACELADLTCPRFMYQPL